MKASRLAQFVCAAGLASACMFGLAACSEANPSGLTGGTAATVNGTEIPEDTVTTYIQSFRANYKTSAGESSPLDTEEKWGQWLAANSMTPETVREQVIDFYTSQELVKQAAVENGVEPTAEDIDGIINNMKSKYDSDEAWQQALSDVGTTEEAYRESVSLALTESALKEAVGQAEAPTDEELLEYCAMYDGARRSSHILFNAEDEATAQEVLGKINSGELDFAEAAKEYSQDSGSAEKGGDVGWDKLTQFVSEYTTALNGLEKDQVSELVESQFGWHIIKCTDVFEVSEEGLTSTDQVPAEILETVKTAMERQKSSQAFNDWYTSYKESADIVINPMPENVPYNLDMSKYQTDDTANGESGNASTDGTADGSDESADASQSDGGDDASSAESQDAGNGAEGNAGSEGDASGSQQPAESAQ